MTSKAHAGTGLLHDHLQKLHQTLLLAAMLIHKANALLVLQANSYFRKNVPGVAASAVRKQADVVFRKWAEKAVERGKDVSLESLAAGISALVNKHRTWT